MKRQLQGKPSVQSVWQRYETNEMQRNQTLTVRNAYLMGFVIFAVKTKLWMARVFVQNATKNEWKVLAKLCTCQGTVIGKMIIALFSRSNVFGGNMVTIYLNGKRITKEKLKNIEVPEAAKRILSEKLTKSK